MPPKTPPDGTSDTPTDGLSSRAGITLYIAVVLTTLVLWSTVLL